MTVLTVGTVATVVTGGLAAPIAAAAALGSGGVAAGGAVAGATAAGAVAGATTAGAAGATAAALAAGPLGWIVLGAEPVEIVEITGETPAQGYTLDCWKAVLHDEAAEASQGKLLRDVCMDARVKQIMTVDIQESAGLPSFLLKNMWDEEFRIEYLMLSTGQLVAHAAAL